MKKILALLITIAGLIGAVSGQTAKPAEGGALLYKISGKDLKKPSYIYGTIHIICPNEMFGVEKLVGFIDQTDSILMELDLDNPEEMKSAFSSFQIPDEKNIKDFLSSEQYSKIDEMFKEFIGISVENLKSIHPYVLNTMITTSSKAIGCKSPGSYEKSFLEIAAAKKKNVEGLETIAFQMEKVNRKPMKTQVEELYKLALDPQKSIDEFRNLVVDYKLQNSDELYEKTINGKFSDTEFEKAMLDERNADWIPKIEKSIREKSIFIAVGAGHLGGKNGVIKLLKNKGYKIEAIKL